MSRPLLELVAPISNIIQGIRTRGPGKFLILGRTMIPDEPGRQVAILLQEVVAFGIDQSLQMWPCILAGGMFVAS